MALTAMAIVYGWLGLLVSAKAFCLNSRPEFKDLNNAGESYPIGVWINDWAAGWLVGHVAQIVIKERLGYNVELKGPGSLALDGFYALTGCTRPTEHENVNRGCGASTTYVHINLEVWTNVYAANWAEVQLKYPDMAPKNLGNMGYYGSTAMYVPSGVQQRAYDAEGINLDFFRDYNASRENAGKHFSNPSDLNVSNLLPCNGTALMINQVMTSYVSVTGDWSGVVGTEGNLSGKCFDNYFWYAPGCRSQPSNCFVWVTGGNGWGMYETLMKATTYNMPLASAVASSFKTYGLMPNSYDMMLYWWVPDPTFLRLTPMKITFPEHDPDQWAQGDYRTAARDVSIDKHVSQDLSDLAPEVEEFISRLTMSLNTVNALMLDQLDTGDSNEDVACRWLKQNEDMWSKWLPENGKCFSQFGMYNERTREFLTKRDDSVITCRACPSGYYSSRLEDALGITFVCRPCDSGSFQPSGASISCELCPSGSYQNETASLSCNRCPVGQYQDEEGKVSCKVCPPGSSTRLLGSVSISDCGCEAGSINVGGTDNFRCVPCSEGLECPFSSTIESLKTGRSADGLQFVPQIQRGFYATTEEPTDILRCRPEDSCPGGMPGTCAYDLEGLLCTVCPEGQAQTFLSNQCEDCGATALGWAAVVPAAMIMIVVSYYFTNLEVLTQATPFKSVVMAVSIAISTLQSIAVIGLMSVKWPGSFERVSADMQIVLLDLDALGFSCLSGSNALTRYLMSVAIFPAALLWLFLCWAASLILTRGDRNRRVCGCFKTWKLHFTVNTAGLGLQLGYGTMAAVAMKPLMCYEHPTGLSSLITYPNLYCGRSESISLQVAGISFLTVFVVGFFVISSYAAWHIPQWCVNQQRERVQCFRFFLSNFRFDAYWFVLLVLLRGLGFTLAIVLGANIPPAQTTLASIILTAYAILQSWMRPWKVPVINLTDMLVNACLLLLVNKAIQMDTQMESQFAEMIMVVLMMFIGAAVSLATAISAFALLLQKTGFASWRPILTLGSTGNAEQIAAALKACSDDLMRVEHHDLVDKINTANAYDVKTLLMYIDLISELYDRNSLESVSAVKFSRVNPTVMNRRSVVSLAEDMTELRSQAATEYRQSVMAECDRDRGHRRSVESQFALESDGGSAGPDEDGNECGIESQVPKELAQMAETSETRDSNLKNILAL